MAPELMERPAETAAPEEREPVCHIGDEWIGLGLARTYCGRVIVEPPCCYEPHPDCGRPRCPECVVAQARSLRRD